MRTLKKQKTRNIPVSEPAQLMNVYMIFIPPLLRIHQTQVKSRLPGYQTGSPPIYRQHLRNRDVNTTTILSNNSPISLSTKYVIPPDKSQKKECLWKCLWNTEVNYVSTSCKWTCRLETHLFFKMYTSNPKEYNKGK